MSAFEKILRPDDIPVSGMEHRLEADAGARAAIAKRLGVPAVNRLTGSFTIKRSGNGFDLEGRLEALLDRICVASLEPMEEVLSEDFAIRFSPDESLGESTVADIDADSPEPIPEEGFDLAEILIQQLAIVMDPYPHKEGAAPLAEEYGNPGPISPFEALSGAIAGRRDKE